MLGLLVLVVAALPTAPPELLVDIDTQHSFSHQPQFAGANADGVLYVQFVREGGLALFWSAWDGPPVQLAPVSFAGRRTAGYALGDVMIVFRRVDDHFAVERLSFTPVPHLELLTTVSDINALPSSDSKTRFWWGSPEGTFVTDGTPEGTRKVTGWPQPEVAIGDNVYFISHGSLLRWEDGGVRELGVAVPDYVLRAGQHVVVQGLNPHNEMGEELSSEFKNSYCNGLEADRVAWLMCRSADAGRDIVVTDGTPAGTSVRIHGGDQDLVTLSVASDDQVIFAGIFDGGFGPVTMQRAGSAPPTPFACRATTLVGQTIFCSGNALSSLSGTEVVPITGIRPFSTIDYLGRAGTRALLQIPAQAQFTLSDGTRAGTRLVPGQFPAWPTESSKPKLYATDGIRALYQTTRGAWLTDGTRAGTLSVGDEAEFFGHSVLAADGAFFVHGLEGEPWQPPFGVIGVAGGLLVGRIGCDAFTIDEDKTRTQLKDVGCIERIQPGRDGALLRNSDNQTFLLRKGHAPYPISGDVQLSAGVACGNERCWFLVKVADDSFIAQWVSLETGDVNAIMVPMEEAAPFQASDWVFATTRGWMSFFAVHPNQKRTEIDFPFTIAPDGRMLGVLSDGVTVIDGDQLPGGPARGIPGCVTPWGITVTGSTLHVLCYGTSKIELFSTPLDGGTEWVISESDAGYETPSLPTGGDVWAFSIATIEASSGEFVMSDGVSRITTRDVVGEDFTRVRGGYVFAGTKTGPEDFELWVVPDPKPAEGCTCGQGGVLCSLGLVLLLRRRSFRRAGR